MSISPESPAYRDLSDWVVIKVLDAIRNDEIKSGEALVERALAEKLSISRAPVRDALHKLEKLGIVERRGSRAFVRTWTKEDVAEILVLLDTLIALSIQLCVNRLTPEDIKKLEEIVNETRQSIVSDPNNVKEEIALDLKFHLVIAQAAHNKRLTELIENLWLPMELYIEDFLASVGRSFSLQNHEVLLDDLKRKDITAALASASHSTQESHAAILGGSGNASPEATVKTD